MNKLRLTTIVLFAVIPLILFSCKKEKKQQDTTSTQETETLKAPDFDADSAFFFVKSQTDFGPRTPNSQAQALCADFLQSALSKYADTVIVQPFTAKRFDGTSLNGRNIIGCFNPEKERRVLLGAHWDSRYVADYDKDSGNRSTPIDGANDGASGVGVLLEVARQLAAKSPEVGVDIIFFDAEDQGAPESVSPPAGDWWCLGSQHWALHPHVAGYQASYGILLDMVGDKNAVFRYEYHSKMYAMGVLSNVWGIAYKLGYGSRFLQQNSHPITDDHYYINELAHIPMIDIIHQDDYTGTGFPITWHTLDDNISNIDKGTLEMVGKTILAVIYKER